MADKKISQLDASALPLAGTEVLPIVQSGATKKVASNDLTVKNVRSNATTGILQVVGPADGSTRVMTTPNANFAVARTDAGQSFSGSQTVTGASGIDVLNLIRNNGGQTTHKTLILDSVNDAQRNYAGVSFRAGGLVCGQIIQESSGNIYFDATNDLLLRPVGNVKVSTGNLVIGTSGKGIDFSADGQAAGMTSELLDDYEEGTWTPTFTFATPGDFAATYTTQTGTYTKVGNLVNVRFYVRTSAFTFSTAASTFRIDGLPFTCGQGATGSCTTRGVNNNPASLSWIQSQADPGSNFLYFQGASFAGTSAVIIDTYFTSGTADVRFYGSITYAV